MYKNFFGFRERPFKLVPNPDYLFLSRSHEEALAHLTYAVSQGDGFVLITGEVGTGKTTLCRSFLENLDEKAKTAYIFNPKLDSVQLLKAISDEFGLDSSADSIKALIDGLNAHLIEEKRAGNSVIILIDEAQNLTRDVLEQLRLLSNLETTKEKLMQIILVGQPELGEMLDAPDLRQLAQRITLACHLRPFNLNETTAYITHRLNIASMKPRARFTRGAISAVYQYSGGVPRRINILCDRALLTAFGLDKREIDRSIVRSAIRELSGKGEPGHRRLPGSRQLILPVSAICLALIIFLLYTPVKTMNSETGPEIGVKTTTVPKFVPEQVLPAAADRTEAVLDISPPPSRAWTAIAAKAPQPPPPAAPAENKVIAPPREMPKPAIAPDQYFGMLDHDISRHDAVITVLSMWPGGIDVKTNFPETGDDGDFFRQAARQNGFLMQRVMYDLDLVRRLNLPAVLAFRPPGRDAPVFLALCRMDNETAVLKRAPDDPGFSVTREALAPNDFVAAYIPWKNFYNYEGVIPGRTSGETLLTLKMHLREIGYENIPLTPEYGKAAREAVKAVQGRHGLDRDGLVGPLTKIILYNEVDRLNVPLIGGKN